MECFVYHHQVTVSWGWDLLRIESILHLLSLLAVGAARLSDGWRNEQIPSVSSMLGTDFGGKMSLVCGRSKRDYWLWVLVVFCSEQCWAVSAGNEGLKLELFLAQVGLVWPRFRLWAGRPVLHQSSQPCTVTAPSQILSTSCSKLS